MSITYRKFTAGLFLFSLFLFAVSLPLSESFVSMSAGLLMISWALHPDWREKREKLLKSRSVWLLLSIYMVYLIGIPFAQNMDLALYDLRKTMFIPALAIAIGTGPTISPKRFWQIIRAFLAAVVLGILIAIIKLIFRERLGIENIWDITFVSHIRFSFQLILAFFAIIYWWFFRHDQFTRWEKRGLFTALLLIAGFIFLLKSLIGIITFLATSLIVIILVIRRQQNIRLRWTLTGVLVLIIIGSTGYIGWCVSRFYDIEKIDPGNLENNTLHGNVYVHQPEEKAVENGHYVYLYVCEKELSKAWEERSKMGYNEKTRDGFELKWNLIRYMASKGLRKDAEGVAALSEQDIYNIEAGMSNHIFEKRFISIYPRIYKTIWELDVYFRTGNPNYMSLAQRIEFSKAALYIIKNNFFFGVGTGNWEAAFSDAYSGIGSKLKKELYGSSHNQYLNYGVKFGFLGFIWIMLAWIAPVFIQRKHRYFLVIILFSVMLLANFGDSNFEEHMGLSFFMFFYALFLWSDNWQLAGNPEIGERKTKNEDRKNSSILHFFNSHF